MRFILLIIAVFFIIYIVWDHKIKTNNKNRYITNKNQKKSSISQYHKNFSLDEDDDYTIADIERDIENEVKVPIPSMKPHAETISAQKQTVETSESNEQKFERDWDSVFAAKNTSDDKIAFDLNEAVSIVNFDSEFAYAISSGFEEPSSPQKNLKTKPKISADSLSRSLGIKIDPKQLEQIYNTNESEKTITKNIPTNDNFVSATKADNKLNNNSKVYSVYIKAKNNTMLKGEHLLQALLSLGCRYGDMNIFHRYEQSNGDGQVMFSIASMVKPGTLDIDKMQELSIPGVVLFFTYPGTFEPLIIYDLMMKTAYQLARFLDADILDENKEHLTLEHAREVRSQIEVLEIQEYF